MFDESSFHMNIESNQRSLWFPISTLRDLHKKLAPLFVIQSGVKVTRCKHFPRFAGTRICFEF